jgi:hypothetical protein
MVGLMRGLGLEGGRKKFRACAAALPSLVPNL